MPLITAEHQLDLELSAKLTPEERFVLKVLLLDASPLAIKQAYELSHPNRRVENSENAHRNWFAKDSIQAYMRILKRTYVTGTLDEEGGLANVAIRGKEDAAKLLQLQVDSIVDPAKKAAAIMKMGDWMGWDKTGSDGDRVMYALSIRCADCVFNKMREEGTLYFDEKRKVWRTRGK